MNKGAENLQWQKCTVVFDLPANEWPIAGHPANVQILRVDMPLIEMASIHTPDSSIWVNAKHILTITPARR